jgi:hypothetical protein
LQKLKSSGQLWPRYALGRWLPGAGLTKHLLPSEEVARQLVMREDMASLADSHRLPTIDYFNSFNGTFPLFDRKAFFAYFDRQYSNDPPKSRSWYGALNIVLSIGCVIATDSTCFETIVGASVTRANFVELSWRFFQNASSVLLDLLFLDNDLMAVQTLIGMVLLPCHSPFGRSLRFVQGLCFASRAQPRSVIFPHRSCRTHRACDGPPPLAGRLWCLPGRT